MVVGLVVVFEVEIVVFEVDVEVGGDEFVFDVLLDDMGYFVVVEFDDGVFDFDFSGGSYCVFVVLDEGYGSGF